MADDAAFRDQRKTERVPAKLQVGFRELSEADAEPLIGVESLPELHGHAALARACEGHTENLSQGGMSLTGDMHGLNGRQLPKGRKLWLEFGLGDGGPVVHALGVVAWAIEGRGENAKFTAGVMFLGIGPDELDRIGRYVEARSGR